MRARRPRARGHHPAPARLSAALQPTSTRRYGRLQSNGAPDTTFDGDGTATIDFGSLADLATGAALQPDGKIVHVSVLDGCPLAMGWLLAAAGTTRRR